MDESSAAKLDALVAKVQQLGDVCAKLTRENAELRDRILQPHSRVSRPVAALAPATAGPAAAAADDPPISRRRMVGRAVGVAAAGAVASAALVDLTGRPALASDGSSVQAGEVTTGEHRTSVRYDGASGFGGVVLLGNDSTYDGSGANFPAGVGGWAGAGSTAGKGGVANGVYGYTDNGAGNGVVGFNSGLVSGSGAGVYAIANGSGAAGVRATNASGPGVIGTSGSTAGDATAIVGTISSTSPGGFSAGVRGVNNGTGGLGIGVWGSQNGSGWGVYGSVQSGIGVNASGGSGIGVAGSGATGVEGIGSTVGVTASSGTTGISAAGGTTGISVSGGTTGIKVSGTAASAIGVNSTVHSSNAAVLATNTGGTGAGVHGSSKTGRGGHFDGGAAQIQLSPGSRTTHPTNGQTGDLYADKTGRLWFCKKGGTHATWHQIA